MSVVVERGLARCPRCVAVADYAFIESGPNSLRYEVNCAKCGEAYREVHAPVAPDFTAAVGALAVYPPDVPVPAAGVFRQRVMAWIGDARERAALLAGQAASWMAVKRNAFRRGTPFPGDARLQLLTEFPQRALQDARDVHL